MTLTAVAYQCSLAYVMSLIIYQLAHWIFEGGSFGFGTVVGFILLAVCAYGLFFYRPKWVHPEGELYTAEP